MYFSDDLQLRLKNKLLLPLWSAAEKSEEASFFFRRQFQRPKTPFQRSLPDFSWKHGFAVLENVYSRKRWDILQGQSPTPSKVSTKAPCCPFKKKRLCPFFCLSDSKLTRQFLFHIVWPELSFLSQTYAFELFSKLGTSRQTLWNLRVNHKKSVKSLTETPAVLLARKNPRNAGTTLLKIF